MHANKAKGRNVIKLDMKFEPNVNGAEVRPDCKGITPVQLEG